MKKCIFIIPYFGKFPDSFKIFLKTCALNDDFDFLFITDDDRAFEYPANASVIPMSFEEIRRLIQSKFDFDISLNRPYKLCDYKPAYGYIFEDLIKDYLYWGHCDIDTVLGNLNDFLDISLLEKYDKLFCLGHMILYRNTQENNRVFMLKSQNRSLYKEYFSSEEITAFDETWGPRPSVNTIFMEHDKSVLNEDWSLNFKIFPTAFTRVKYNPIKNSFDVFPKERAIYTWENGKVFRYVKTNDKIIRNEEMYIHLQGRKMRFDPRVLSADSFKIIPNRFVLFKSRIASERDFNKESRHFICFHYFEIKWNRLKRKVFRLISG
jgi:hypothetical protein